MDESLNVDLKTQYTNVEHEYIYRYTKLMYMNPWTSCFCVMPIFVLCRDNMCISINTVKVTYMRDFPSAPDS